MYIVVGLKNFHNASNEVKENCYLVVKQDKDIEDVHLSLIAMAFNNGLDTNDFKHLIDDVTSKCRLITYFGEDIDESAPGVYASVDEFRDAMKGYSATDCIVDSITDNTVPDEILD